jgi:nucleoside-diphosphate-sugar epimerase
MSSAHVVVTGGAGFLGSHLSRALLNRGDRVTVVDNFSTGRRANLAGLAGMTGFALRSGDITQPAALAALTDVTHVVHLACPASPKANAKMPIETIKAGSVGTINALELARTAGARALVASSSEIYGDPLAHPQGEDYRGNTDPVGPLSAYTEVKRVTEATAAAYRRMGADVGIIRPFNVYGPYMWPDDGRVVSSFCAAALDGKTLHIHNGGAQTRSLVWAGDFTSGLIAMLDSREFGPVNLGSCDEVTIRDLARLVVDLAGSGSLEVTPGRDEVVTQRRPDATRARKLLGWQATTPLRDGICATLAWMREIL